MLRRNDIRFNEYFVRFLFILHMVPVRFDPTTGKIYLKSNRIVGKSFFLLYKIVMGGFIIFCTYRSIDVIVFSETWDPVQFPFTLMVDALAGAAVAVMYILLDNLDKAVKIYNGLFNLNEDKGSPRSITLLFPILK